MMEVAADLAGDELALLTEPPDGANQRANTQFGQ